LVKKIRGDEIFRSFDHVFPKIIFLSY
jgi:hypothetical protein